MKKKITAIIQCRMQSERLPNKAMFYLAGKPLIAHVIERTKKIENVDNIIVATSDVNHNDVILKVAESYECTIFVGSDTNVLERFVLASRIFNNEYVLRITADNPFISFEHANDLIKIQLMNDYDLLALIGLPIGTGVEIVKHSILETLYSTLNDPYDLEHVTIHIKNNPDNFNFKLYEVKGYEKYKDIRLTVDYIDDYKLANTIYNKLYNGEPFTLNEVIKYFETM